MILIKRHLIFTLSIFVSLVLEVQCVDPSSLNGKVMFGYQGWFGANGDGLPGYGYRHWSQNGRVPGPGNLAIDPWPDFSEYPQNCLFNTTLVYSNGSMAKVYSCYCPGVVDLHFKWLQDYNLDGVFLQRFVTEIQSPGVTLQQRDQVSLYVKEAAEKYNRVFGIMYDVSGANSSILLETLKSDWNHLANILKLNTSSQYICQNNKPVVVIWGFGFTSHPPDNVDQGLQIINYFKNEANVYLVGGVPFYWLTGDRDSKPGYLSLYQAFDALSPWAVGRYGDNNGYDNLYASIVTNDKNFTDNATIGYAPVIFPGFSWSNLQKDPAIINQIPRAGGNFFNHQADKILGLKPSWIYLAMFDEVNEGTALYKIVSNKSQIPLNANFTYLSYDGTLLDSDAFLKFASQLTSKFHVSQAVPQTVPQVVPQVVPQIVPNIPGNSSSLQSDVPQLVPQLPQVVPQVVPNLPGIPDNSSSLQSDGKIFGLAKWQFGLIIGGVVLVIAVIVGVIAFVIKSSAVEIV